MTNESQAITEPQTEPESRIALTDRLRREGRWNEASVFRDAERQRLRKEGASRQEANERAWQAMAANYPPLPTPPAPVDPNDGRSLKEQAQRLDVLTGKLWSLFDELEELVPEAYRGRPTKPWDYRNLTDSEELHCYWFDAWNDVDTARFALMDLASELERRTATKTTGAARCPACSAG